MGIKGDKHTGEAELSAKLFVEKLSAINGITSKKMFGGHGIFHEGKMFGIVDSTGQVYLKTNEDNASDFVKNGAIQHGKMPYHSVPDEILNSNTDLIKLVKGSINLSK